MTDTSLAAEFAVITGATDPEPLPETIPSGLPWESDPMWALRPSENSRAAQSMIEEIERADLFEKVFGNFTVEAEPKLQKHTSLREVITAGVESTIAQMDDGDLRKALAAAPDESDLQIRKQTFIKATAGKRSERLSGIICEFSRALENKGMHGRFEDLTQLQRAMNAFVEDVLMVA